MVFKKSLEQDLAKLQESLDLQPNQVNLDHYNTSKKELEQIENEEISEQIFRSKIKWAEEG